MELHIHKDLTDDLDVVAVLNVFVSVNDDEQYAFWLFSQSDFLSSIMYVHVFLGFVEL